jgi:hypothetical protein
MIWLGFSSQDSPGGGDRKVCADFFKKVCADFLGFPRFLFLGPSLRQKEGVNC